MRLTCTLFACLIAVNILPSTLVAQAKLDFEIWDVEKGLTNRNINYATRDADGFLWLVSSDIEKYDGYKFTRYNKFDPVYNIPVSGINTAISLHDSLLVFSSTKDLYKLNMYTGKSAPMPFPEGMPDDYLTVDKLIKKDHHPDIMMITGSENYKSVHLIDNEWKHLWTFNIDNQSWLGLTLLRSYANGPAGVLWLMDEEQDRVLKIKNGEAEYIPFDFDNAAENWIYRIIYADPYGLFIIRNDGTIHCVSNNNEVNLLLKVPIQKQNLSAVHLEQSGALWVIFLDQVIALDPEELTYKIFHQKLFGRTRPEVHHIFEDEEATTWVCSEIGLIKIKERINPFLSAIFSPPGQQNIQYREIFQLNRPNEFVCRVAKVNRHIMKLTYYDNLVVDTATLFRDVPGSGLYHQYGDGLLHVMRNSSMLTFYNLYSGKKRTKRLPVKASFDYYNQSFIHGDTLYYQDTKKNITCYNLEDGSHKTIFLRHADRLMGNEARVMKISRKGQIILGTEKNGLFVFEPLTGRLVYHLSTETQPALTSDFVNCVIEDKKGILWIGTLGGGVNRADLEKGEVTAYTQNDGLPNDLIASMVEDDEGDLWIGTYRGLSRFNKSTGRFYNYFKEDGIPDNEFNYLSSFKAENGHLYIGTFNGITIFDPKAFTEKTGLPQVKFTAVQKFNRRKKELTTIENGLSRINSFTLSPYDNYIHFEFALPSFTSSGTNNYLVLLQGMEEKWTNIGKTNYIRYQKLPPGDYTFKVKAIDANGTESIAPATMQINAVDFFYKSWWFISILMLTLTSAFYLFYRYRINLLRRESETRSRIASDLHDEIGSTMTRISMQLQMLEPRLTDPHKSTIAKIGAVVDESIVKLRDLVWSVNMSSDRWEDVIERMEEYAYDTLMPRNIAFTLSTKNINGKSLLKPMEKRNIYLIFKEAINNAAKHTDGDRVKAILKNEGRNFSLTIEDNGNKKESPVKGNGLANLTMRAERLKGTLDYGFHKETGFIVELNIPRVI